MCRISKIITLMILVGCGTEPAAEDAASKGAVQEPGAEQADKVAKQEAPVEAPKAESEKIEELEEGTAEILPPFVWQLQQECEEGMTNISDMEHNPDVIVAIEPHEQEMHTAFYSFGEIVMYTTDRSSVAHISYLKNQDPEFEHEGDTMTVCVRSSDWP